jgi:DeoR family transcriptional regulator, fructose operon transcriptional repressor
MQNRIYEIYHILEEKGTVSVAELVERLKVSEASIRRDLRQMEDSDMIRRFYGGATISETQIKETSLSVRDLSNKEAKTQIAKFAASLIKEGDIVYIDGGSTTVNVIDFITARNILVVTQAINNLEKLIKKNIRCYIAGGYLKNRTSLIVSGETIDRIKNLKFNIAFLGANGVHSISGFTANEEMEAKLKQIVIENTIEPYIIADSSKVNKLTVPNFAQLSQASLVTDALVKDFDYSLIKNTYYLSDKGFIKYEKRRK